jgi:glycosyltransferase involved in cell wall biosynthesis
LQSLRHALAQRFEVEETNLLDPPLNRREQLGMLVAGLLGLSNNWRYRSLAHRLPAQADSQLTLLVGNYCACLAPLTQQRPLLLDLVDSLTLTDMRGMQSRWRWRPLLYLLQLPSSWLLEHRLKRHRHLQGVLITTEREQAWLERLHGPWTNLHVIPNQVQPHSGTWRPPALPSHGPLQLAFIGSLHWWVNLVSARRAVQILERFLQGPGADTTVVLNLYGTASSSSQPRLSTRCKRLQIIAHGYVDTLASLAEHNHAAFLPNPIGRGFQNKLLSCVALGLPTIAHTSMSPHSTAEPSSGPVIYCESQSDYDQALLSLWNLKEPERIAIARASENYIEHFFSSTAISRSLNEALD